LENIYLQNAIFDILKLIIFYLKKSIFAIFILFFVSYYLLKKLKIRFVKELPEITIKAYLQLIFISLVLLFLLKIEFKYAFLLVAALITYNAAKINLSRFPIEDKKEKRKFLKFIWISYFLISLFGILVLFTTDLFSFSPEVIIPLIGISVAGAMRGVNLLISSLFNKVKENKDILESVFALGGSQKDALELLKEEVLYYSTLNTRDMLKAAGIVHIPGVMVGLLLAGTPPIKAATIQFLVLNLILFNVVVSSFFAFKYFSNYFPYPKFFLDKENKEKKGG